MNVQMWPVGYLRRSKGGDAILIVRKIPPPFILHYVSD